MITSLTRSLCLAGGLSGAALLSQYPAFTQQYMQRLAGQVDALGEVVADFDRSALDAGLTRSDAMAQLDGTTFLAARRDDMQRSFSRYATLTASLDTLRSATPMQQLLMPHRLADTDTFRQTLGDFSPALPVTSAGGAAAGVGFLGGWAVLAALFGMIAGLFRKTPRSIKSAPAATRSEPPLSRPATTLHPAKPILMGETRP